MHFGGPEWDNRLLMFFTQKRDLCCILASFLKPLNFKCGFRPSWDSNTKPSLGTFFRKWSYKHIQICLKCFLEDLYMGRNATVTLKKTCFPPSKTLKILVFFVFPANSFRPIRKWTHVYAIWGSGPLKGTQKGLEKLPEHLTECIWAGRNGKIDDPWFDSWFH